MRTFYTLVCVLFCATSSLAQDPVAHMREMQAKIEKDFPPYVAAQYKSYVTQVFGTRQFDALALAAYLNEEANLRAQRVTDLGKRFSELLRSQDSGVLNPEEPNTVLTLGDTYTVLQQLGREASEAQGRNSEAQALEAYWKVRCSTSRINELSSSFLDPKLLFPYERMTLDTVGQPNMSFQIGYGAGQGGGGYTGGISSSSDSKAHDNVHKAEAVALTVASYAVCMPPAGPFVAAGLVAAVILVEGIWALCDWQGANKKNRQMAEIAESIYAFMASTVKKEADSAATTILDTCSELLPTSQDALFTVTQAQTQMIADGSANVYRQASDAFGKLVEKYKIHLNKLNTRYFKNLLSLWESLGNTFYQQRGEVDQAALLYAKQKVFPALQDRDDQLLWGLLLEGELSFASPALRTGERNVWSSLKKQVEDKLRARN